MKLMPIFKQSSSGNIAKVKPHQVMFAAFVYNSGEDITQIEGKVPFFLAHNKDTGAMNVEQYQGYLNEMIQMNLPSNDVIVLRKILVQP